MRYRIICLLFLINLITSQAHAQSITLRQLGKTSEHFSDGYLVYFNKTLYTINYGALYKTELDSGHYTRLGNSVYKNIRFFFAVNNRLHIIETDGSMLGIDPVTGERKNESPMNTWVNVGHVVGIGNTFLSFENGICYKHTALDPNSRRQIGKAEFYDLGSLIRSDSRLFSIIGSNLYQINILNGEWIKIGKGKAWKGVKSGAALNDKFYSIESDGKFWETNLADGAKKELDNTHFIKGGYLFAEAGKLYTIIEGTLYEISLN